MSVAICPQHKFSLLCILQAALNLATEVENQGETQEHDACLPMSLDFRFLGKECSWLPILHTRNWFGETSLCRAVKCTLQSVKVSAYSKTMKLYRQCTEAF